MASMPVSEVVAMEVGGSPFISTRTTDKLQAMSFDKNVVAGL